jgi:hypothetical protein
VNNFAHTIDRFEPLLLAVFVPIAFLGGLYGIVAKAGTRRRLMAWESIHTNIGYFTMASVLPSPEMSLGSLRMFWI